MLQFITFTVSELPDFKVYSATNKNIKFLVGDIFKLTPDCAGTFDAIWDCNALVALSVEVRVKYAELLTNLLNPQGRILMATWEYNQAERADYPFSIPNILVKQFFGSKFNVELLARMDSSDAHTMHFLSFFKLSYAFRPIHMLVLK